MTLYQLQKKVFEANVCGTWHDVQHTNLVKKVYTDFQNITWKNTYFLLNFDVWPADKILNKFDRYVISFHYQYVDLVPILELARNNPESQILLICDHMDHCDISTIEKNITTCSWVTWHHQISQWAAAIGTNQDRQDKQRRYKISCLNGRYEIHKLIVASAIYAKISHHERLLSWQGVASQLTYDQQPDFFVPDKLREIIAQADLKNQKLVIDKDISGYPIDWNYPAYTDCYVNFTVESVFNDVSSFGDKIYHLPGPMLTEKTWKPILGGCCFVPVAQKDTVRKLTEYGFCFDFIDDLNFDCVYEFERLSSLVDLLDFFVDVDLDYLHNLCEPVINHNLNNVLSGAMSHRCDQFNLANSEKIHAWMQ